MTFVTLSLEPSRKVGVGGSGLLRLTWCQRRLLRGCCELDDLTAPILEDAIADCREGWPVIVDLSGVEFISSAGLHTVLRERSASVSIVAPQGNVTRLFEIVRANRRCPLFHDLDSAIYKRITITPLPRRARPSAGSRQSGA